MHIRTSCILTSYIYRLHIYSHYIWLEAGFIFLMFRKAISRMAAKNPTELGMTQIPKIQSLYSNSFETLYIFIEWIKNLFLFRNNFARFRLVHIYLQFSKLYLVKLHQLCNKHLFFINTEHPKLNGQGDTFEKNLYKYQQRINQFSIVSLAQWNFGNGSCLGLPSCSSILFNSPTLSSFD